MIQYNGMKAEKSKGGFGNLPAGPYVGVIKNVRIEGNAPDQQLALMLEVAEGPHTNYFTNRYKHDSEKSRYEPKYKGILRLRIPNENNPRAMYPETDLRRFNDALACIQESNPGFIFNGDENTLKGKTVGFSMQLDSYNGVQFTRIAKLESAIDVRAGKVEVMAPRERSGDAYEPPKEPEQQTIDQQTGFTQVEDDGTLPF